MGLGQKYVVKQEACSLKENIVPYRMCGRNAVSSPDAKEGLAIKLLLNELFYKAFTGTHDYT